MTTGPAGYRHPKRVNGWQSYQRLLEAAERLLTRDGPEAMTIRRLAMEAGVPKASIYHFFHGPDAVALALSERYTLELVEGVCRPIDNVAELTWQEVASVLVARVVGYYRGHPCAQSLMLGSNSGWSIRQADIAQNHPLVAWIAGQLTHKVPHVPPEVLTEGMKLGLDMGDAIYSRSVAEHGTITDQSAKAAETAICAYLGAKVSKRPPVRG